MKKATFFMALFAIIFITTSAFKSFETNSDHFLKTNTEAKQNGKAFWFVTYLDFNKKKMHVTPVFNNNCNYCYNEIREAYKKHLIMNDYDTGSTNTANMSHYHDVDEKKLEKRREEQIYKRKQQGIDIVYVNFNYKED